MALPYHGRTGSARAVSAIRAVLKILAVLVFAISCGSKEGEIEPPPTTVPVAPPIAAATTEASDPTLECTKQPFAESLKLAEASAATLLPDVGLLVIADSGHRGAYELLDPETGTVLERGRLSMPKTISDDIEGVAATSEGLVALTSSGVVLEYTRSGRGFVAKGRAYDVGPPIPGCSNRRNNCGLNWEGICIGETDVEELAGCVGAAVSKRRGSVVCLDRNDEGGLRINSEKSIDVANRGVLSGCTIASRSLWVVSNALGANTIHIVSASGRARFKPWVAASFEAIAATQIADDGVTIAAFSDTNRGPSRAFRYRCNTTL